MEFYCWKDGDFRVGLGWWRVVRRSSLRVLVVYLGFGDGDVDVGGFVEVFVVY